MSASPSGNTDANAIANDSVAPFPTAGILPKAETQSDTFLVQRPQSDGRGILVAIFDTGTDVHCDGLITTTDGKPKIVDAVDCSGSGDVSTGRVVTGVTRDGVTTVTGMTGRTLTIPSTFTNPTNNFHIGVKRAYELFPEGLVSRMKKERRRVWDERQRELETYLYRHNHEADTDSDEDERSDRETRLSEIKSMAKNYDDPGPIYDVIVWHDGTEWWACVDTSETGNLAAGRPLRSYHRAKEFDTFCGESLMNYSVNIHDNGDVCEIVIQAGSHGTHVAGIVAAHFPDKPELNGIAPGAQLVSVKIGDSRLGSMETGVGLMRGIIIAWQRKVDLINMSYGEASSVPNTGRFIDSVRELINRYGVIFVSSAGNAGPALTSAGTPGSTTTEVIGVGAFVSPAMMLADYSLRKQLAGTQFTWSSRGPTSDGATGVSVSAPGGAITSVPTFTLQSKQLMNGTSMSSPNACGGLALILSAAKQSKIQYSPHRIRRAIENTAKDYGMGALTQGAGLLQVASAYKYLSETASVSYLDHLFRVSTQQGRGVYLREPQEVSQSTEQSVTVEPQFYEPDTDADTDSVSDELMRKRNTAKVNFELRIALQITVDWIECPSHLMLMHAPRAFNILVHPNKIGEPGVHYTEIVGVDSEHPECGALFRVPVTVIVPEPSQQSSGSSIAGVDYSFPALPFTPGHIVRKFVRIPNGASYVDFRLKGHGIEGNNRSFMFHSLYLMPDTPYRDRELNTFLALANDEEKRYSMDVQGDRMLEVTLALYWNVDGDCSVDLDISFHGVSVDRGQSYTEIVADANTGYVRLDLSSTLRTELLDPKLSLAKLSQPLRPSLSVISALSNDRDTLPRNRHCYELVLQYAYECKDDSTKLTMVFPLLQGVLYESIYESQFFMIFDANKRLVGSGDAWPKAVEVKKGKYVIRVQVRHDDVGMLEKLKDMLGLATTTLAKPIELQCYATYNGLVVSTNKFGDKKSLKVGQRRPMFVALPDNKALPSHARTGDVLTGSVTIIKSAGVAGKSGAIPLRVTVPPPPLTNKESAAPKKPRAKLASPIQVPEKLDQQLEEQSPVQPVSVTAPSPVPAGSEEKEGETSMTNVSLTAFTPTDATNGTDTAAGTDSDVPDESLAADLRDLQIDYLQKQKDRKKQIALRELLPSLTARYPIHLPLLFLVAETKYDAYTNGISYLGQEKVPSLNEVLAACDAVINEVGPDSVAAHFGRNHDSTAVKVRKEYERKREALVAALTLKLNAIIHATTTSSGTEAKDLPERFESVYREWTSFVDLTKADTRKKYVSVVAFRDQQRQRVGAQLKAVNTVINEANVGELSQSVYQQRIEALKSLVSASQQSLVRHWLEHEQAWNLLRFPEEFTRF